MSSNSNSNSDYDQNLSSLVDVLRQNYSGNQVDRRDALNRLDQAKYDAALKEVLAAVDPLPEQRLTNTIAKRKAKRYLTNADRRSNCGF